MRGNPGILYKISSGMYAGQFAIGRHSRQRPEFQKINKLFVEFYTDQLCQKPVLLEEKKVVGLIDYEKCIAIGFVD